VISLLGIAIQKPLANLCESTQVVGLTVGVTRYGVTYIINCWNRLEPRWRGMSDKINVEGPALYFAVDTVYTSIAKNTLERASSIYQ